MDNGAKGANRLEMACVIDNHGHFWGALMDEFLPLQLVYKGKMPWCHPHFVFPLGGTLLTHQSTGQLSRPCCSIFFCLCMRQVRERLHLGDDKPVVAIIDNFKGQIREMVTSLLETNNVHVCLPNTTNLSQPMDITVSKPEHFLHRVPALVLEACHEAAGRTGHY